MKMKRVLMTLLVVLVLVGGLVAFPLDSVSTSAWAMAGAGLSLDYAPDSFAANPALLAMQQDRSSSFVAAIRYEDAFLQSNFSNHLTNPLLEHPQSDWALAFTAGSLAFSIQNRNALENRVDFADYTQYTGKRNTLFQFDWATGKAPLYFGLTAKALGQSERNTVEIGADRLLLDYFIQTAIGSYEPVDNQSSVSFGLGLLLDYHWFKMGVVTNQFAYSSSDNPLVISFDSLLKTMDWGFSFSSPTYDGDNQLHLFKIEAAVDLLNISSNEDRQFRAGLSMKLQLLPTWTISFLTGYREPKATPSDLLSIDLANGFQTFGLIIRMDTFNLICSYGIPTAWYLKQDSSADPTFQVGATLML